jgi:hypothetical protein
VLSLSTVSRRSWGGSIEVGEDVRCTEVGRMRSIPTIRLTSWAATGAGLVAAVTTRNRRWWYDGLGSADNGEKVPVAFAVDFCDREAMDM